MTHWLEAKYWRCDGCVNYRCATEISHFGSWRCDPCKRHAETDNNDATCFLVRQAEVIRRAVQRRHDYIDRITRELEECRHLLLGWDNLNHRQIALLGHAIRHPGMQYTIEGHQRSHATAYDTARRDLLALASEGFVAMSKRGRAMVFSAAPDLLKRLKRSPRVDEAPRGV